MRKPSFVAVLVAAALLPGCLSLGGGPAPEIRRHSIDLPDIALAEGPTEFGPIIVRQFSSRARYEPRVVVVDGPGRVAHLDLDRWADEPAEAVTTVIRESLAATGAFEAVAASTSEMQTDLVLDGALLACDVLRATGGPWRARLVVRLEVTKRSTGDMVAARAHEAERDLPGAGTAGLGEAMGACVDDVVAEALAYWRAVEAELPPGDSAGAN